MSGRAHAFEQFLSENGDIAQDMGEGDYVANKTMYPSLDTALCRHEKIRNFSPSTVFDPKNVHKTA
jgi:hypothetical protein